MFLVKTEDAESRDESADDITAAAMHPIPTMETKGGVRCCRAMGSTSPASPRSYGDGEPYEVRFQSGAGAQRTFRRFRVHGRLCAPPPTRRLAQVLYHLHSLQTLPVEDTAAPSRTGGTPKTRRTKAATVHVSLAVAEEDAARVLWWKH